MPKKAHLGHWLVANWIALVAILISVFSLSVSVEQCEDTRLHDQPRLFFEFDYNSAGAGWNVENIGLGPARLRGFKISFDGKPVTDWIDFAKITGVASPYTFNFTNPAVGVLYASGVPKTLFWVTSQSDADALRSHWTQVRIEACYCSIHGQCWAYDSSRPLPDPNGDPRDDSCSAFKGTAKSRAWNG
jgi:hypothetical protein